MLNLLARTVAGALVVAGTLVAQVPPIMQPRLPPCTCPTWPTPAVIASLDSAIYTPAILVRIP